MKKPKYDPMFQVVVPIGLLDDLVAVHVEQEKGKAKAKEESCKHCNALQHLEEIRIALDGGRTQMERMTKAALSGRN